MPLRRYILTSLVVACIVAAGALVASGLEEPLARYAALGSAALFSLAIIRSTLLKPFLVQRRWQRYAADHGDRTVIGRHGEPRMVGDRDGIRFIVAQSTSMLGGGGGYYARTVVTAAVERGVPDGLRIYRKDALEWMHHLSGLRQVTIGNPSLDDALMIEGTSADEAKAWIADRTDGLRELAARYPRFIVFGSEIDGMPASVGGASGAITLIVVGRKSRASDLDELIDSACRHAREFG